MNWKVMFSVTSTLLSGVTIDVGIKLEKAALLGGERSSKKKQKAADAEKTRCSQRGEFVGAGTW